MTITHVGTTPSVGDPSSEHGFLVDLLGEASTLRLSPVVTDVLELVSSAVTEDTLTAEVAFSLGQQLRLAAGDRPVDGDVATHQLLQTVVFELSEVASHVEGIHVDELRPLIDRLAVDGDIEAATRLMLLADAAYTRMRILSRPLAADVRAA